MISTYLYSKKKIKKLGLLLITVAMLFNLSTTSVLAAESKAGNSNTIKVLGIANEEALNLEIDYDTMKLKATGKGTYTHYGFGQEEYFRVEIKSEHGFIVFSEGVKGNDNTLYLAQRLNGFSVVPGDRITVYHKEAGTRLRVYGPVIGAPNDLTNGLGAAAGNSYNKVVSFEINNNALTYEARIW